MGEWPQIAKEANGCRPRPHARHCTTAQIARGHKTRKTLLDQKAAMINFEDRVGPDFGASYEHLATTEGPS